MGKFLFVRFWKKWVWPDRRWGLCLALQVLFFALSAVVPFLWGRVTDTLAQSDPAAFVKWIALYLGLEIAQIFFLYMRGYKIRRLEMDVTRKIDERLYGKYHSIPYSHVLNSQTGDAIQRITNDVSNCSPLIIQAFSDLAGHIVLIVIIMALMFLLSPILALISIAVMCVYALGYYFYQKKTPAYVNARQQAQAKFISSIEEGLEAAYSIRVQGSYRGVMKSFGKALENYFIKSFAFYKFGLLFQGVFSSAVTFIMEVGIIAAGAWLIFSGRMTVGSVISFSLYINWLVVFVNFMSSYAATVEPALVSLKRIEEVLNQPDAWVFDNIKESPPVIIGKNAVEVKGLSFSFDEKPIFNELSLEIPAGRTAIIKAESGRGKSTLLNLLLKIYPSADGRIYINGMDINALDAGKLLGMISVVEQEPKFYGDSLLSSVTGGDTDVSKDRILDAAKSLGLGEFLEALLSRESTKAKLSELSGGERKRLGMIRGLVRQTPITILDEPTAFLDSATSFALMERMRAQYPDRTFIIFTHDPLLDSFADTIIRL